MTDTATQTGRWYPNQPPRLAGETADAYTNRLTGADRTSRVPYDHQRNRQCSIGWHMECSDPHGVTCECPCHDERINAEYHADQWNGTNPAGTRVHLPAAPEEPVTETLGAAYIGNHPGHLDNVAVVDLTGWPHPVALSWLEPTR